MNIGPGGQSLTAAQQHVITTAIAATPGTLHYLSEADDNLSLPGLPTPTAALRSPPTATATRPGPAWR